MKAQLMFEDRNTPLAFGPISAVIQFSRRARMLARVGLAALACLAAPAMAQTVSLGTAQNFAVLGASTVTNTGPTVLVGDLGVSPGNAITGFPPGTVTGTTNAANAVALQAQNDLTTAYNTLAGRPCGTTLTGDLGGRILTPGVYCYASSAQLTGTLTLDALGDSNAVFIFQIGSTLTTASNSRVLMVNGGRACNVFFQVGSSATLGTATVFSGNILAQASITLTTGSSISGRALARTGAVTLDTNNVTACQVLTCPVITVNPATLPDAVLGTPYSQTVVASGSAAVPYTYSVSSGALPNGLTLNAATGVIAGTPNTGGVFTFTITAADTNGCIGTRTYTIRITLVACVPITVNPNSLPAGAIGAAYAQTFSAAPAGVYTFQVSAGSLPNGLALNTATGVLSGRPTTAGSFAFTITATDANVCGGSQALNLTIGQATAGAAIPTLSEWAMILLAGLLAIAGFAAIRRRT